MKSGIYRFINNRTGEVYVGQSHNVFARRAMHHKELESGTHHNKGLQEDHDRGDTFTFEILEKMPEASREELEEREIYYIKKFNSFYEGYNQTPGGKYDDYKGYYEHGGDRLPSSKYNPVKRLTACPNCGGELVKREGRHGYFAGCSNYPKCSFSCSLKKVDLTSITSTCKSCGKKLPEEHYIACPFCASPLDEDEPYDENVIFNMLTSQYNDSGITFKQFRSKKRSYLNRFDCDFLSKEYNIDIGNANTVKESNSIIKNYLKENDLWDCAMEDLFIYNIRLSNVKYKQEIGEPVLGKCPDCGNALKRRSELFITCATYPDCDFSCIADYYYDHILRLRSESESPSSTENSSQEHLSETKSDDSTPDKITSKYARHDDHPENAIKQEKTHEKDEINKSKLDNGIKSVKNASNENINCCSNCGCELDSEDKFCGNCGASPDGMIEEEKAINETSNMKDDSNEINGSPKTPMKWKVFIGGVAELSVPIIIFFSFIYPVIYIGFFNELIGLIGFILSAYAMIFCIILLILGAYYKELNAGEATAFVILIIWNGLLCFVYYLGHVIYILNP